MIASFSQLYNNIIHTLEFITYNVSCFEGNYQELSGSVLSSICAHAPGIAEPPEKQMFRLFHFLASSLPASHTGPETGRE